MNNYEYKTIVLNGTVEQVIKSNFYGEEFSNNYKIIKMHITGAGKIVVKGSIKGDFKKSDKIEVYGIIKEDQRGRYIEPITCNYFIDEEKGTNGWLEGFLQTINGVGKVLSKRIVDTFKGEDFYTIIRETPERLREVKGLNEKSIKEIYTVLVENLFIEEYIDFIINHGGTLNIALRTFKSIEKMHIDVVKSNPYILLNHNISFVEVDKIAFNLGVKRNNTSRIGALILKTLQSESKQYGNIFVYLDDLYDKVRIQDRRESYNQGSPLSDNDIKKGILELIQHNYINYEELKSGLKKDDIFKRPKFLNDIEKSNKESVKQVALEVIESQYVIIDYERNIIYLYYNVKNERDIAEKILSYNSNKYMYLKNKYNWEQIEKENKDLQKLDIKQRESIKTALNNKISILTGGPGTGKTYTLKYLIKIIKRYDRNATILLTAPTGKASRRMEEVTGVTASTIHKLINYIPDYEESELQEITSDFLIVDEVSMVSSSLFSKLLSQVSDRTQILLVGDIHQLPSITAGNVLEDLINSNKVPTVKLNKIFRQEKGNSIIENSYNVLFGNKLNIDNKDTFFISNDNYKINHIQGYIAMSVNNMMCNLKYTMEDIQILTPVKDGPLGVTALNNIIQNIFNKNKPSGIERNGYNFRLGDKVINTRNNYDLGVLNGEIGIIKRITDDYISVEINGKLITFRRKEGEFSDLELAYALTVHKSQGSQYKVVIFPSHNESNAGANMNLIYTAITRASEKIVIVGHQDVFYNSIKFKANKRNTALPYLLGKEFKVISNGVIDWKCEYQGVECFIDESKVEYKQEVNIDDSIFDNVISSNIYNPATNTVLKNEVVVYKIKGIEDVIKIKNSPTVKYYAFKDDLAYVLLEYVEANNFKTYDVILEDLDKVKKCDTLDKQPSMILF